MTNKAKDISMENHTYYFFDDFINIKNFDPNNIKVDKKSYKDNLIYYLITTMICTTFTTLDIVHFQQSEWLL